MTDLLQQILADPELSAWPRYSAPAPEAEYVPGAAADPAEQNAAPAISTAAHDDLRSAVEMLAPYIDGAADQRPINGDAAADQLGFTPPAHTQETAQTLERTAEAPPETVMGADSTPEEDVHNAEDSNSDDAPLTFDDIAAKRNGLVSWYGAARQWLADQDWKSPRTLGATAAAIVTVAALVLWLTHAGNPPQAPTAQVSPSGGRAPSSPAPAAPVDAPVVATAATARCPAPSSDPMNALRPESTKPWTCQQAWGTVGQLLVVTFDKAYVISRVSIVPGADAEDGDQDMWAKYRTVRALTYSFNDVAHTRCDQDTHSQRQPVALDITAANCTHQGPWQPVVASGVTIKIRKTELPSNPNAVVTQQDGGSAGTDYTAFAVSHLEIVGHPSTG